MANNGTSTTPVVEDDPTDDLASDPSLTGKSIETDEALSRLREVHESAGEITEDPIPLIVAQIDEEIHQLLRVHRDIYDGIELATDQVQDKRIEFLEAGPEVSAAEIFIEVSLVFFLESPLAAAVMKQIVNGAFRFVGGNVARLASRAEKLKALRPAAARLSKVKDQLGELDQKIEALRRLESETIQTNTLTQLRRQEADLLIKRHDIGVQAAVDRATVTGANQRAEVTGKKLKEFFETKRKIAEEHGIEFGLATALAAERASTKVEKEEEREPSEKAPDSIGVQIKAVAQAHLRDMELYLGLAATDADMLRSIALSEPFLRPDCFNLLSEMLDALARLKSQDEKPEDVKRETMLAFEKLIWALLFKREIDTFLAPPLIPRPSGTLETIERIVTSIPPGPGGFPVLPQPDLTNAIIKLKESIPDRLLEYFNARFPTDASPKDTDMLEQMSKLAEAFLQTSENQDPFKLIRSLAFKKTASQGD